MASILADLVHVNKNQYIFFSTLCEWYMRYAAFDIAAFIIQQQQKKMQEKYIGKVRAIINISRVWAEQS